MRRILIWTVLALLTAFLVPFRVEAQAPGVVMDAAALYEGASKYGEWLPVVVDLENNGPDVNGQAEVLVSGSGQETIYAQHVELPRGSRKQVTIYVVPNNFSRRLVVEFVPDEGGDALASEEVEVRPVPNIRYMIGVVSAGGDGFEPLASANFRGTRGQQAQTMVLPLDLATLPDRPEALRTLDLIVFSGVDTSALTPRQRASLEQYVAQGGVVALAGGPEAARVLAGIPESLMPVTLTGETSLESLGALEEVAGEPVRVNGPFPAAVAEPVVEDSARTLEGELPLVVEREVGDGAVLWMALDPALSPFDAWAGTDEFWLATLGQRAAYPADIPPDMSPRQVFNEQLFYALQNLPSLDLPSLRLLVPLLAIYILIVGPVNYFVLRRRRHLELAWVTIPVITLLFSVGAYGLGFQLRGSDVILNQVAVVRAVPDAEGGYVRSMLGVFSPSRRTYTLEVEGEALVSPTRAPGDPFSSSGGGSTRAMVVQGEPTLVQNFTVNQWSMQSVVAERLVTEGYSFGSELVTRDDSVVGTVTNTSGMLWENVAVVLGSQFQKLGDIAPGESKEVSLRMTDVNPQMSGDVAWRLFENEFGPNGANRDTQVRQQILSGLFNSPTGAGNSPLSATRQPLLLAWLDGAPTEISIAESTRLNSVGTTLLYAEMPIRYGAGPISLPRGLISARVAQNDGGTCYGPGVASLSPDFLEAEIHFQLPAALRRIDPTVMTLYLSSDGGLFVSPKLSLYDFTTDEWQEVVDPVMGRNRLNEPDAFVSENGLVRLRAENLERNRGGCIFLDVAMDGTLPGDAQAQSGIQN